MKYLALVCIVVLSLSCKKEVDDSAGFKTLDIEDAYGIVLGKFSGGTDTALKLIKLNSTDNLQQIKFLNGNKDEVYTNRVPVAIYNINSTHFLVTFTYGSKNLYESYLVRRFDGNMRKINTPVVPELAGNLDVSSEAIKHDYNQGFYFVNSQGYWKLDLTNSDNPTISQILMGEEIDADFTVDYLGNILTPKKVYHVSGNSASLVNGSNDYSYPINSFINNMYYLHKNGDSIQCSLVDVSNADIGESKLLPSFKLSNDESAFVGSHAYPEIDKILIFLSGALLQIEGDKIKSVNLSSLNLKKIASSWSSDNYCYVYGENTIGQKVFVRIDPSKDNFVYTQVMAPNAIEVNECSVSQADKLIFSATRIEDTKKLFGYIPLNGNNWIIDDDEGIDEIQVLFR